MIEVLSAMSNKNDTSKPEKGIKSMALRFKEQSKDLYIGEIEKENTELKAHIVTLLEKIQFLETSKIDKAHPMSDEELIALMQIQKLLEKSSMGKELSLEELKKYDILVKNKRLAQGSSTVNAEYKVLPDNITEDGLLQIAEAVKK